MVMHRGKTLTLSGHHFQSWSSSADAGSYVWQAHLGWDCATSGPCRGWSGGEAQNKSRVWTVTIWVRGAIVSSHALHPGSYGNYFRNSGIQRGSNTEKKKAAKSSKIAREIGDSFQYSSAVTPLTSHGSRKISVFYDILDSRINEESRKTHSLHVQCHLQIIKLKRTQYCGKHLENHRTILNSWILPWPLQGDFPGYRIFDKQLYSVLSSLMLMNSTGLETTCLSFSSPLELNSAITP